MTLHSGIYSILNLENGRHYVGSSQDLKQRWKTHKRLLGLNKHHAKKLQFAWNKYGENSFRFDILELAPVGDILNREQFYMDKTAPFYNTLRRADGFRGYKHTAETKLKMALSATGRLTSEEVREKLSRSHIGIKFSDERVEQMRRRRHTDEAKSKIGLASSGRIVSEKTKKKLSAAALSRSESEKENNRLMNCRLRSKWYVLTSPSGANFLTFNLAEFSRKHNLDSPNLSAVANGRRKNHKGWLCRIADDQESKSNSEQITQLKAA